MPYVGYCLCICHSVRLAVVRALLHRGDVASLLKAHTIAERPDFDAPVYTDVHSVVDAAIACPSCLANHAPALSTAPKKPPPKYKPPTPWEPSDDD